MAKNAFQSPCAVKISPSPTVAKPKTKFNLCCPANCTGAPWNSRNLYLPESFPNAITEPLKVIAPMAAPKNNSKRLPAGIGAPFSKPCSKAWGSATAATAMNTAAKPIMLCIKATNSGILVISTRLAMTVPAVPPTSKAPKTHAIPDTPSWPIWEASFTIKAAVVTTATAMPTMPKTLPRIEVVGCDSPLSAWIKQTLANKYSKVTRFRLIARPPLRTLFSLSF